MMAKDHHRLLNVFSDPKRFRTATVKARILDTEKLGNIGIDMSELRCKDLDNIKCFRGPLPLHLSSIFSDNQRNGKSYVVMWPKEEVQRAKFPLQFKGSSYSPSHTPGRLNYRKLYNTGLADGNRQESLAAIWYPDHREKNRFSKMTVTREKNEMSPNIDHKREKANTGEPRVRFKPIPCDICNREFGSYSIAIHRQQCMKKWMSNSSQRQPNIRS